jgi:hypothetical protein
MTDKLENVKPIAKLLEAVRDVIDRDVALKLYAPEDLRLTVEKRQAVAKALIASGVSERNAARALGVGRATVRRDVGKLQQPGPNRPEGESENPNKSMSGGSNRPDHEVDPKLEAGRQAAEETVPRRVGYMTMVSVNGRMPPEYDEIVAKYGRDNVTVSNALSPDPQDYQANARHAILLAKQAANALQPILNTLSEAAVAAFTKEALAVADRWREVAELVRKGKANKRGHIEVVK